LADERRLNDERKKKMKVFVESKSEELRQARAQADDYNLELSQTNRSMREHQARWKQLHAQWVQSQTRNRELQRELNKLQKDQETANRMGDKMEMQMAKSAQETTLHKTKRLTAKHELMTVLRTLDAERELSGKLRDSIKFSFTPKALSQQQLMKESLKDLERELVQLSRRLGRPLPPSPETAYSLDEEEEEGGEDGEAPGKKSRSEIDTEHLLSNLEEETQRVSQCIMTLGTSIERLHMVLSDSGERNCVGVLHDILSAASGSQTYGQVRTNDMS
jgi:chromosome segregation ATPase